MVTYVLLFIQRLLYSRRFRVKGRSRCNGRHRRQAGRVEFGVTPNTLCVLRDTANDAFAAVNLGSPMPGMGRLESPVTCKSSQSQGRYWEWQFSDAATYSHGSTPSLRPVTCLGLTLGTTALRTSRCRCWSSLKQRPFYFFGAGELAAGTIARARTFSM